MAVGFRVAELRAAKGWTQAELAEKSGVSRATVMRLEDGDDPPSRVDTDVLAKIARVFNVEPGYLILSAARTRR